MKTLSNKYSALILVAGLTIGLGIFLRFTSNSHSFTSELVINQDSPKGLPMRLQIASLGIDAAVESVGTTPQGAMDVPKNPANVAWYNLGARPGEQGSAVLAGHLDDKNGKPAVFANLDKLHPGDKVIVQDNQGRSLTFVVRENRIYDSHANASEIFTSATGTHLNLITCSGTWDKSKKSYNERLVVFTDLLTQ